MLGKLQKIKANTSAQNKTITPEPEKNETSQIIYEETFLDVDGTYDNDIRGRVIKRTKTGSEANKSADETLNLSSINDLTDNKTTE